MKPVAYDSTGLSVGLSVGWWSNPAGVGFKVAGKWTGVGFNVRLPSSSTMPSAVSPRIWVSGTPVEEEDDDDDDDVAVVDVSVEIMSGVVMTVVVVTVKADGCRVFFFAGVGCNVLVAAI